MVRVLIVSRRLCVPDSLPDLSDNFFLFQIFRKKTTQLLTSGSRYAILSIVWLTNLLYPFPP
jgi:hypothetical protein